MNLVHKMTKNLKEIKEGQKLLCADHLGGKYGKICVN